MINKTSFENIKKGYTQQQNEIFKKNNWSQKEIYLREEVLNDRERILKEWEKFKNTFRNNSELLSLAEQFLFSHVLNRNGLLEKGLILKEILEA